MKTRLWGALLSVAGLCLSLSPAPAIALSAGECAKLSIRITGRDAARAECEIISLRGDGDGSATSEYVQISEPGAIVSLSHAYAGTMSFLLRIDVKSIFKDVSVFESTSDWGEEDESGDFDVRSFKAKFADDGPQAACVAFSHYAGHVARTTGYRHHISGFYCDLTGTPPPASRIDELLGNIEHDF